MSEQSTPAVAPGWYPDQSAPGVQRWWDGIRWTDHVQHEQSVYQPFAPERAPEGTKTGTVWIWLVALLPLVSLASIFTIDFDGYFRTLMQNPTSPTASFAIFTPAYLIGVVLSWASVALTIVFAFLDWRELKRRGVPQPFHWAWSFLVFASAGVVYPIGRSVVVKRRTGGGMAPMWVAIAVLAVTIIVVTVWTVMIMTQMMSWVMSSTPTPIR